jgi:DNA-binding transcriptional ArsR family regulator
MEVTQEYPPTGMEPPMVRAAATDEVFHALANQTRRQVLERLSAGPATVSELAAPSGMQLPSFVQHLAVLERSRLVRSTKRGRVRTFEIASERFQVVEGWLAARRRAWEARFDRFDDHIRKQLEQEKQP